MPELPEVETIARQLNKVVAGRKVKSFHVWDSKLSIVSPPALVGASVVEAKRVGKRVVLVLRKGRRTSYLAIHLRMTGRLVWRLLSKRERASRPLPQKHERALLRLDAGDLIFSDVRRFGTIVLCRESEELSTKAVDPLVPEFTTVLLADLLAGGRQALKPWLLRQDKICGIGNIYACEVLHRAAISPFRRAGSLSLPEVKRLHRSLIDVLTKAIACCGTTFSDFVDSAGDDGGYQRYLRVYMREGRPCRRCRYPIARQTQQGRSTYFCPACQA